MQLLLTPVNSVSFLYELEKPNTEILVKQHDGEEFETPEVMYAEQLVEGDIVRVSKDYEYLTCTVASTDPQAMLSSVLDMIQENLTEGVLEATMKKRLSNGGFSEHMVDILFTLIDLRQK